MLGTKKICRVRIAKEELEKMSSEDYHKSWQLQDLYIDSIEAKLNENVDQVELANLRESEKKLKQQQLESNRREQVLMMRLTTKEHEMQDYAAQVQELKQAQIPGIAQLRSALLDPAINVMFEKMRKEIDSLKARLEETQNELNAWKFTPDSNTGKRLMAKCRLLYQENEELGKMISSGKMAKLEGDLALQKTFSEEMKKSQSELDEFLLELDEDVEGMQSTICYLQQELRLSKEQVTQLRKEKSSSLSLNSSVNHCLNEGENLPAKKDKPFVLPQPEINDTLVSSKDMNSYPVTPPPTNSAEPFQAKESASVLMNSGHAWSPPKFSDIKSDEPKMSHLVDVEQLEKRSLPKQPTSPELIKTEAKSVPTSVVVCHQPIVRGSLHMEEYDSEQEVDSCSTELHLKDQTDLCEKSGTHAVQQPLNLKMTLDSSCKRTTENGSRGRKRTRSSRSMVNIVEEDICREQQQQPAVKRLRRRNIIVKSADSDQKRTTPLEINTDTEVQVAQTLAMLAATKQERIEAINKSQDLVSESLGNGELKGNSISDDSV